MASWVRRGKNEFKTIKRPKLQEAKILERRKPQDNQPDSPSHFPSGGSHPFVCGTGREIEKLIQAGLAKRLKHEAELLARCWADK